MPSSIRCANFILTFLALLQAKKDDKEARLKENKRVEHHLRVAEEERRRMKEFDDYLVLAKYNP